MKPDLTTLELSWILAEVCVVYFVLTMWKKINHQWLRVVFPVYVARHVHLRCEHRVLPSQWP
jgi:hypothetical protein